jgi:signal transduction histidine kinase
MWCLSQLLTTLGTLLYGVPAAWAWVQTSLSLACGAFMLAALGSLADSPHGARITLHLSNLGLVACFFVVLVVVVLFEPVAQAWANGNVPVGALLECAFLSLMCCVALYHLWTQRWDASWLSMLVMTLGTASFCFGNFGHALAVLAGDSRLGYWVHASWTLAFMAVGLAAQIRRTPILIRVSAEEARKRSQALAALMPALLLALMVGVGVLVADQITARVLTVVAALGIVFAVILGARQAWGQRESQRLTRELRMANARLSGTNRQLLVSETRVRDLHGHLEERIAERTQELQRAYEELESFAYAVAHDLRSPLRAIDGFGQMLEDAMRERDDPRGRAYVGRIRRSALKMAALIEDLLAYSRIERRALSLEPIALDELLAGVCAQYERLREKNIELRVEAAPVCVLADREALALVLHNLIGNAIKFSASVPSPRIEILTVPRAARLSIVVRDNGIGFDMQYREQIFKLFHRLHRDDHYEGTGIGLALVYKALERMGGSVHAESKEGEGATFVVELPIAQ